MDQLSNLSQFTYLVLYLAALWVAVQWALLLRTVARRSPLGAGEVRPDPVQLARLAGGRERAVHTVLAHLVTVGAVRLTPRGVVRVHGATAPDELSRMVLDHVPPQGRDVRWVTFLATWSPVFDRFDHDLARRGLLPDPAEARRLGALGRTPLLALLLVGAVRWADAVVLDLPLGMPTLLLVLTGVVLAALELAPLGPAHAGRTAMRRARAEMTRGQAEPLVAVALDGPTAHPDPMVAGLGTGFSGSRCPFRRPWNLRRLRLAAGRSFHDSGRGRGSDGPEDEYGGSGVEGDCGVSC
ncbi:MAG TPA: TIGR04222 domain-containing membrane protein [Pseudonocardiaceae bacterium]